MIYFCETCGYKSERAYDMKVHTKSVKHLKNVGLATKNNLEKINLDNESSQGVIKCINSDTFYDLYDELKINLKTHKLNDVHETEKKQTKIYLCPFCKNQFSCSQNVSRHKKTCKYNKNNCVGEIMVSANELDELKKTNLELKQKLEEMNGITQQMEKLTHVVEKALVNQKNPTKKIKSTPLTININNNDNSINNSINNIKNISNVMKYINKTYNFAEPLTMLPQSEAKKMLENTRTKKYSAEDFIVYYYDKHLFDQFIGDVILRVYKKENPDEQQIWASDVERLSFIIRRALEEGGRLWMKDVQGVTIIQYIINPILNEVKEMIKQHNTNCITAMHDGYKSLDDLEKLSNDVYNCAKILRDIDDKVLQEEILRYIIPKFQIES